MPGSARPVYVEVGRGAAGLPPAQSPEVEKVLWQPWGWEVQGPWPPDPWHAGL